MSFFSKFNRLLSVVSVSLCSLLFVFESASAQTWLPQNSGMTGDLLGVFFLDENNGWAVGGYWDNQDILHSVILHTNNGGNIWQEQSTNANSYLFGITFADLNNGWACGWYGVMLHTTDGGINWITQLPGTEYSLMDVTCVSQTEAWAVGQYATILHTLDRGLTWIPQVHPLGGSTIGPRKIVFRGRNLGWAFGEYYTVFNTKNGGWQWTYPGILTSGQIMGGDFADDDNGWAVGSEYNGDRRQPSLILHTTDGGANWRSQSNAVVNGYMMDAAAIDANNAWIAGYTGIFRTTNAGATWINQPAGTRRFYAMDAVGDHNAWAVGEMGTIRCYMGDSPINLGSVNLVSPGPPNWSYRLNWISGSLSRLTFTNICAGTIGSVTGDAAVWGWQANNYMDSVVFTTFSPMRVGSLTGFHLFHPSCSDSVAWNTGDSSGVVDGPLPIELISFDAFATAEGIRLNFSLASELNNDHFEIWRGETDDGPFSLLTMIPSQGNSSSEHRYEFVDPSVNAGVTYWYYLADVDISGNRTEHTGMKAYATALNPSAIVYDYSLSAFPNPFNPNTTISFTLPEAQLVRLTVFNVEGRQVKQLVNGILSSGSHQAVFEADNLPSGVYVARIESGNYTQSEKLLLLK